MTLKKRGWIRLLAVAAMTVAAAGLWAGGQGEAKGAATAGPVKLTVWDVHTVEGENAIMNAVIARFQKDHPNVTIERTARQLDDDKTATMAALNAGAGPDVVTANNGETEMGPMVRAGYLINLDSYSAKYGWEKNYLSPSLWNRAKYTTDGKTFGTGSLYGVPIMGELVGVYYNRDLFDKLGIAVPKTFADFEAAAEKLKAAGVVPIAYGAAEVWPFFQIWADILAATLSDQIGSAAAQKWFSDAVIKGDPSIKWTDPAVLKAAQIIKRWADTGYFTKGFTGLAINDALQLFLAGKTGMFVQGSWFASDVAKASFNAGMFAFPPMKASDGMVSQVGGMTTPNGINKASKNKDLAAAFLDIMLSSTDAHAIERDNFMLPPTIPADLKGVKQGIVVYDLLQLWNDMNKNDRVGQYLDWTTPDMGSQDAGPLMLAGNLTPEQFCQKMQATYTAWITSKK